MSCSSRLRHFVAARGRDQPAVRITRSPVAASSRQAGQPIRRTHRQLWAVVRQPLNRGLSAPKSSGAELLGRPAPANQAGGRAHRMRRPRCRVCDRSVGPPTLYRGKSREFDVDIVDEVHDVCDQEGVHAHFGADGPAQVDTDEFGSSLWRLLSSDVPVQCTPSADVTRSNEAQARTRCWVSSNR